MRRNKLLTVLAAIVIFVAAPWLTVRGVMAQTPLPITIGYQDIPDWLLFTARELKLFEKAGLAPTYVKFVAGLPMIEAAQTKSIDVASLGTVPFLIGLSKGADWAMFGISAEGPYV